MKHCKLIFGYFTSGRKSTQKLASCKLQLRLPTEEPSVNELVFIIFNSSFLNLRPIGPLF